MTDAKENVSRETTEMMQPPPAVPDGIASGVMQRIGNNGIQNIEKLCSSAAVLTDRYFLPLLLLVELRDKTTDIHNITIHGPANIPIEMIVSILGAATGALERNVQPPDDADADQQTGDPAAAQAAMTDAMTDDAAPRPNGADG